MQILYLKIFIQDPCNFHADVADFSNYVAFLEKSLFYPGQVSLATCFLGDDVVLSTVFWVIIRCWLFSICPFSTQPFSPCCEWQNSDLCGLYHVHSFVLSSPYGSTCRRSVGGRRMGSEYIFLPPTHWAVVGSGCVPLLRATAPIGQTLSHHYSSCWLLVTATSLCPSGLKMATALAVGAPTASSSQVGAYNSPHNCVNSPFIKWSQLSFLCVWQGSWLIKWFIVWKHD